MNIKKNIYSSKSSKVWDNVCFNLGEYSYFSSYEMINYYSKYKDIKNISFAVYNDEGAYLALVPLAIFKKNLNFPNDPCPSISVNKNLKESEKRKVYKFCLNEIYQIMKKKKLKTYNFFTHPFQSKIEKNFLILENISFLQKYSKLDKLVNTSIIDLKKDIDRIFTDMSKYHKKNINRSYKKDINFFRYDEFNKKKQNEIFLSFKRQHFINSGKKTRPNSTWLLMKNLLTNKKAQLYFIEYKKKKISYLFVGTNNFFSFGWSQVNDKKFENEIMPRHVLEWEAIKDLKKRGILYYDIGEIYDWHSENISDKQYSISTYKEKFGGTLYPKLYFKLGKNEFKNILK